MAVLSQVFYLGLVALQGVGLALEGRKAWIVSLSKASTQNPGRLDPNPPSSEPYTTSQRCPGGAWPGARSASSARSGCAALGAFSVGMSAVFVIG